MLPQKIPQEAAPTDMSIPKGCRRRSAHNGRWCSRGRSPLSAPGAPLQVRGSRHITSSDGGQIFILKPIFFVVAVLLSSKRVVIRIIMDRKATRTPHMVPWGWGEGRKKYFVSLIFYGKKYYYLSTLLNSNKKTSRVNIDSN